MATVARDHPTLTPAEFSEEFRGSRNTVNKLLNLGEIPAVRIGRKWAIPRSAIAAWLASAAEVKG